MKKINIVFIVTGVIILALFAYFTITPPKSNYEKANKDNIKQFDITNSPSSVNQYSLKDVETENMAKLYYNDYKNMIINYPDEAYEIISDKEFSESEFRNYRDQLMNNYYSYEYKTYSYYIEPETNYEIYTIIDNEGTIFTIKVFSVMQYEVSIKL